MDRVLDVRQGELCWVAGTVYMDMPLKPNILDDISKDVREDHKDRAREKKLMSSPSTGLRDHHQEKNM